MDLVICKVCKEPVWNFICVDCLAKDIERVLPREFHKGFYTFHNGLINHFTSYYDFEPCIRCKNHNPVSVCPYCYLNEAFSWLLERDTLTAKKLIRFLPIFRHHSPGELAEYAESQAVTELENRKTLDGICDECGEYSEGLEEGDNGWTCPECR